MYLNRNRISDEKNTIIIDSVRKSGYILEKKIVTFLFCFYDKEFSGVYSDYGTRHMKWAFGRHIRTNNYKKLSLHNKKARWIMCKIIKHTYNYGGFIIDTKQYFQGFEVGKEHVALYVGGTEGRFTPKGIHTNNVIQNSMDYDQSLLVY